MLAILSLGLFCYHKYVIQKDYPMYAEGSCDPSVEVCFVYTCDPETEECVGNPEEDTYYYKEIRRMANQFPDCNPNSEDCLIDRCNEGEIGCDISLCDPEDVGLSCASVEDFSLDEPQEENAEMEEVNLDESVSEEAPVEIDE